MSAGVGKQLIAHYRGIAESGGLPTFANLVTNGVASKAGVRRGYRGYTEHPDADGIDDETALRRAVIDNLSWSLRLTV